MDPITISMMAIGLGMQIFGGMEASDTAHEQSQVSRDEALQEQGINDLKQKQMEMEGRRKQLEDLRTAQRATALATARATNQGAQFSSGLQGGLAQVTDQSLVNITGVNNALEIGRGINSFNQKISQDKMKMADLGADMSDAQGISSLGGSLIKAGPMVGAFSSGFGSSVKGMNLGSGLFGGGSPSGYGIG